MSIFTPEAIELALGWQREPQANRTSHVFMRSGPERRAEPANPKIERARIAKQSNAMKDYRKRARHRHRIRTAQLLASLSDDPPMCCCTHEPDTESWMNPVDRCWLAIAGWSF